MSSPPLQISGRTEFLRSTGVVAVAGITVGLAAAFAGGRLIQSPLYGVSSRDPSVFTGMTVLLLGVVLLACWLPARRAARLSPLEAFVLNRHRQVSQPSIVPVLRSL